MWNQTLEWNETDSLDLSRSCFPEENSLPQRRLSLSRRPWARLYTPLRAWNERLMMHKTPDLDRTGVRTDRFLDLLS